MLSSIALASLFARPLLPRIDAGTMLSQAMTAVVEGSKDAIATTDVGFKPGISVLGAYVRAGDKVKFSSTFEGGRRYIVAAGGNDSAEDIDVAILDEDGKTLAKDDTTDAYAVAAMDSTEKQKVSYVVTNSGSKAAFVCVAVLTNKQGWAVHSDNLSAVISRCKKLSDFTKKEGYRFYTHKGSWCLFGGLVEQGKSMKTVKLAITAGDHAVIGFSDDQAEVLNLALTNEDGDAIGGDTSKDNFPVFDFPSGYSGPTDIELINAKGGASFSMFGIFEKA